MCIKLQFYYSGLNYFYPRYTRYYYSRGGAEGIFPSPPARPSGTTVATGMGCELTTGAADASAASYPPSSSEDDEDDEDDDDDDEPGRVFISCIQPSLSPS